MKLSTGVCSLGGHNRLENIEISSAAGFKHFDYSFGEFYENSGFYADFDGYAKLVKATMAELGIDFVLSHAPAGKPFRSEENWKTLIDATKTCIRACHEIGVNSTVVHSGYLADISKEECFELNRKFYREILEEAEKYGIYVLVENYNKMERENIFWIDNATDLLAMVKYIDHPLCQACWDAGHANLQEMPQDEELRILGNCVMATHIHDNHGERDTHLVPFQGTLNLDSVMKGLIDIGYKGTFNYELEVMFADPKKRRAFSGEARLGGVPREIEIASQKYIYQLGKTTLEAYGVFED